MTRMQPSFTTARLILRPFVAADAAAVCELAGAREIADTTISIPHPYPIEAAEDWTASRLSAYESDEAADFALILRATGELIGSTGLRDIDREHSQAELGFWIGVPWWGRGFASEAAGRVLEFGFVEISVNRIYAHHMVRNPASGAVLRKLGFKREGTLRQRVRKWGEFEDVVIYGLLSSERLVQAVPPAGRSAP